MPLNTYQAGENPWVNPTTGLCSRSSALWLNSISQMFQWSTLTAALLNVSAGTMTISALVVNAATYQNPANSVNINLGLTFTTGGTATNAIKIKLPQAAVNPTLLSGRVFDNGAWVPATAQVVGSTLTVERQDGAAFHLGAGEQIQVSGSYQTAS
jgi:hypothetical protein